MVVTVLLRAQLLALLALATAKKAPLARALTTLLLASRRRQLALAEFLSRMNCPRGPSSKKW